MIIFVSIRKNEKMLQIDDKIISFDILENHFVCDLNKCKGNCCVQGASGAPLAEDEAGILNDLYPDIKPFLRPEGAVAIEQQGVPVIDVDGDEVTPLIDGKECAYVVFDRGIAFCGIEKAYLEGRISFRKPISCQLYPIRVKQFSGFTALNDDRWTLCEPARALGKEKKVRIFEFVREALIRAYGKPFYEDLNEAAEKLNEKRLIERNQSLDEEYGQIF